MTDCKHDRIQTWRIEDGTPAGLWSCVDCAVKFVPMSELEREKASRQAAQIENEDLKARIARSGVEQQRAVWAEREACARVCDERAMKNEHACEGLNDEDATGLRSAAWQMSVCAAAIRARGAAPQQPEGEPT